ncbi:MAG: DUF4173 domain-containing protein [Clostridia bacterium]|nr:DUF4173 domain-containing protein [Clostridia bacterium]
MENNIINNDKKLEELVGMLVEKKIEELAEKKLNQNETPKEMPEPAATAPTQQSPVINKPFYPEAVPVAQPQIIPVASPKPKKDKRSFTVYDTVFAWLSYILGYLFCRSVHTASSPLGATLFIAILFAATGVFLHAAKRKPNLTASAVAISAVVISLSFVFSSNTFIHFFAFSYAVAAYCYFVYASSGNKFKASFSNFIIADFLKSAVLLPFKYLSKGEMLIAVFQGKTKKSMKLLLKLIIGLAAAAIPTAVVLLLLLYDASFESLINRIFDFDIVTVLSHVASLFYAVFIGMFIYSIYISSVDGRDIPFLTEEKITQRETKIRFSPVTTSVAASVPLLAVYVIFFISQWKYYISGFTGVLPKDFSYAEYAREGFFQLCAVSAINLVFIALIIAFSKKSRFYSLTIKALTCIFSAFTLVLISTAIAKMVMYINYYGLTQKRVYATWFMAVLALVFIAVALSRFIPKIKIAAVASAIVVVAFAVLSLCNVDSIISKYNVDRYLDGSLKTVDVAALSNLGDAAVPDMVRLAKHYDKEYGTDITEKIPIFSDRLSDYVNLRAALIIAQQSEHSDSVFGFSLNSMRAEKALKELGKIKTPADVDEF